MAIPAWNLAPGANMTEDMLRSANNFDMSLDVYMSRTEVVHRHYATTVNVTIEELVDEGYLQPEHFVSEDDGYGNSYLEYIGGADLLQRSIERYVSYHGNDLTEWDYVDYHHEEHYEWHDSEYDLSLIHISEPTRPY